MHYDSQQQGCTWYSTAPPSLPSSRVVLTAGPWPPQISKTQRRSTVAGVIMLRVVGCQMQDDAWTLVLYWWINPRKLQLIGQSIHGWAHPRLPSSQPSLRSWLFCRSMQRFPCYLDSCLNDKVYYNSNHFDPHCPLNNFIYPCKDSWMRQKIIFRLRIELSNTLTNHFTV